MLIVHLDDQDMKPPYAIPQKIGKELFRLAMYANKLDLSEDGMDI